MGCSGSARGREGKANPTVIKFLLDVLEIHEKDLYSINGPLDLTFLFKFHKILKEDFEHLVYETFIPQPPNDIHDDETIFDAARKRDVFLHHPYESFQPVVDLIIDAAKTQMYWPSNKPSIVW